MSWKDFDLAPRIVSGAPAYNWRTDNAVEAAPVRVGSEIVGYIATSVDPAENVLKLFTSRADSDYFNAGSRFWRDRIAAAGARRLPAHETFRALLGCVGPDGAGEVSETTERFDSTDAVVLRLDPARDGRDTPTSNSPMRAQVDAVLRGQARPSRDIQVRIAALDEATAARPVPEDVIVALPYDPATLPADAEVGTVVHEPTYLTATFFTAETRIDAPATLILRVTKGTPALYTPPGPGERGAGVLLLGRGLDWRITSLARGEIRGTVVRGG